MKIFTALLALLVASPVFAAMPWGNWISEEDKAEFVVYEQDGKLVMKLTRLSEKTVKKGISKDFRNADPALRERPLVGLIITGDCTKAKKEGRWEGGTVYTPKEGKSYKVYVQMIDDNRLEMRGYMGIPTFGKSQFFTRLPDAACEKDEAAKPADGARQAAVAK